MIERMGVRNLTRVLLVLWIVLLTFGGWIFNLEAAFKSKLEYINVILITVDTLRADHLGCYGYKDTSTPAIDLMAKEGVLFTRHYTPVPITFPSHVTILTGLYPPSHGVRNNGTNILGEDALTLAEILKKEGYDTAAFVGAYVLHSRYGLNQGFDVYDDRFPPSENLALPLYNERPAEEVTDLAIKWMEGHRDKRFFLWIHLFDPHAPYSPPEPFRESYKLRPYDGEIVYIDSQIGRIQKILKDLGIVNKTLLVFTADHGEGLDEHGEKTHAVFIYDSTLHIPLIFQIPDLLPAGKRLDDMVCSVDIMPTILDILGITPPLIMQGYSLCGLIKGEKGFAERAIYCESYYPELNFGWNRLEGIRAREWKYIDAPKSELYQLDKDPKELQNLYHKESEIAENLRKDLYALKDRLEADSGGRFTQAISLDAETRQRLESLGYIWTEQTDTKGDDKLPDPKDMINALEELDVAMFYSMLGLYHKAIQYLERVVQTNPANLKAHFYLASNYEKAGDYDKAVIEYQKVIKMNPGYSEAHNSLGAIYEKEGSLDLALEQLKLAERLNGNYMEVYHNLGVVYDRKMEYEKALLYLLRAIELVPDHPSVRNNLGGVYLKMGRIGKAIEEFQKVIDLEPKKVEAYNNLAIAYKMLGDHERAESFFIKAIDIDPEYAGSYSNLAAFHIMRKKYDQAIVMARKALDCDKGFIEAYLNLGIAYFYLHHYKEAINYLEEAINIDNDHIDALSNLGLCYLSLKDYDKAKLYFQKTLNLEPQNIDAQINLGTIYFKNKEISQAISLWDKSLEIDPNSIEAYVNLGLAYFERDEYKQAIVNWKHVLQINPSHTVANLNLGNCYYKMGLINLAVREWQKAISLDDSSIAAHTNLATAYYHQERMDLALTHWQRVNSLDPGNAEAAYYQGLIFLNLGNFDQAKSHLNSALRLNPSYYQAHVLLEQVKWLANSENVKKNDD